MIARRQQVALALTALLAGGAACQAHDHAAPGHPAPAAAAPRGFTLVASGDVLPHSSIIDRARFDAGGNGYDFRPMLAGVRSVVSRADLALCHMETVYGANGDYTGYPTFKSPPEVAQALAVTGYDGCSTASNHSLDDGAGESAAPSTPWTAPVYDTPDRPVPRARRARSPSCARARRRSPTSPTPTTPTASRCPRGSPGP